MKASWPTTVWEKNAATERFFMFFFPYFHFQNIWGNFVGYTAMPNRKFTSAEAKMSAEELAIAALPEPPSPDNGLVTTMAPQGSMFVTDEYYVYDNYNYNKNNCPIANHTGADLCPYVSSCAYAEDPGAQYGAPSVAATIGMLVALSIMYLLLAGYWAAVFCRGNGAGQKFYFFLLPSYWCSSSSPEVHEDDMGVTIDGLKKKYGDFEALKGVSFKMKAGEVTALLGKSF
jgi:hypothetical protein